jgi:hypothetical protein
MNSGVFLLGALTGAAGGIVGSVAFAGIIVKVLGNKIRGFM